MNRCNVVQSRSFPCGSSCIICCCMCVVVDFGRSHPSSAVPEGRADSATSHGWCDGLTSVPHGTMYCCVQRSVSVDTAVVALCQQCVSDCLVLLLHSHVQYCYQNGYLLPQWCDVIVCCSLFVCHHIASLLPASALGYSIAATPTPSLVKLILFSAYSHTAS